MVLDKTVKVFITTNYMVDYYRSKGYDCKIRETIEVKIEDLYEKSVVKVNCCCDICGSEKIRRYSEYINVCNHNNGKYICISCSGKRNSEKMKKTYFERHGADCSSHCPEVQDKIAISLYNNCQCKTSKQQLYLHALYGGILNFPISRFNVDICIDNLVIEFDGGGHNLAVKTGKTSQKDFNKRMVTRSLIIRENNYKIITIISLSDKLPSDEILLDILDQSKQYFEQTSHTWREWDIDNGVFRDAEHKDGEPYDFGPLRTIKKSDLEIAS